MSKRENQALIQVLGVLMLLLPLGFISLLFFLWPTVKDATETDPGTWTALKISTMVVSDDLRVIMLVLVAGTLGSFTHSAQSFASYVGNATFKSTWAWWYLLRLPIGGVIALFIYFLIRGGVLSLQGSSPHDQVLLPADLYKLLGFAGLAGMFSKNATDKLMEVFDALFSSKQDRKRNDKLQEGAPRITGVSPDFVEPNQPRVQITVGVENMEEGASLFANGKEVEDVQTTEEEITGFIATPATGEIELIVQNPGGDKQRSKPFLLPVRQPPT